jgi:hemolysin-activating ACP:hemolysin acyltransferase
MAVAGIDSRRPTVCAAVLGLLAPELATGRHAASSLRWHVERVRSACEQDRQRLFFDRYGRPCGHVIWIWAERDGDPASRRDCPEPGELGYPGDGQPCLVEAAASYGQLAPVLAFIRDTVMAQSTVLAYGRVRRGRLGWRTATRTAIRRAALRAAGVVEPVLEPLLGRPEGADMLEHARKRLLHAVEAGHALTLLAGSTWGRTLTLRQAIQRVTPAIALQQYRLLLDARGQASAWLSWAWIELQYDAPAMTRAVERWAQYDWNAGEALCVVDVVAKARSRPWLFDELRDPPFSGREVWMLGDRSAGHSGVSAAADRSFTAPHCVRGDAAAAIMSTFDAHA